MKKTVHVVAGGIALLCVLSFWTSTAISELFLSAEAVAMVKQGILTGMWVLIPAMVITGGSGFSLAGKRSGRFVQGKKKRMPIIALNGLLIMVPCAFFLAQKANAGQFDAVFYAVQALELVVGAIQISLLGMSIRDGLRLTGRLRRSPA